MMPFRHPPARSSPVADSDTSVAEDVRGIDRRVFMGLLSGGVGGAALVGATAVAAWPRETAAVTAEAPVGAEADATAAHGGHGGSADDMDAMHKEGIDAFLANIEEPITEGRERPTPSSGWRAGSGCSSSR
jgi:hypothetical protein